MTAAAPITLNIYPLYFRRTCSSHSSVFSSLEISLTPQMRSCLNIICIQYVNLGNHFHYYASTENPINLSYEKKKRKTDRFALSLGFGRQNRNVDNKGSPTKSCGRKLNHSDSHWEIVISELMSLPQTLSSSCCLGKGLLGILFLLFISPRSKKRIPHIQVAMEER